MKLEAAGAHIGAQEYGEVAETFGPDCEKLATLFAASPELLDALRYASELIPVARKYFPKSIRNRDRFQLENTCATINKAITKVEGQQQS